MRVLVADNDKRVRAAINMFFRGQQDVTIVGESGTASSLLSQAKALKPDLVLIDWELPGNSVVSLIEWLKKADTPSKVVVLSRRPESRQAALAGGADAFVSKTHSADNLLDTLNILLEPRKEGLATSQN